MTIETWAYYTLAVIILTASPGPSSLLCMTRGLTSGWKSGVYNALGSLTAITSILTLSFTGLGVVILSSELIFNVIKWAGAAYLIYLGVKAFTSKQEDYDPSNITQTNNLRFHNLFVSGFVVGASNPKAILFFTALFPQFIDPSMNMVTQYSIFASTFVLFEITWLVFYAYLGSKSSKWIFSSGRAKLFNRLTGGVFIGAGALLSTTSRS